MSDYPVVNVYIESHVKNGEGDCIYVLEFLKKDGTPVTRDAIKHYTGSKLGLDLRALIGAVSLLKTPTEVRIFTSDNLIRSSIINNSIPKWEENGWKTSKGKRVQCSGLWKYLKENCWMHRYVIATSEVNTYHEWLMQQLEKVKGD